MGRLLRATRAAEADSWQRCLTAQSHAYASRRHHSTGSRQKMHVLTLQFDWTPPGEYKLLGEGFSSRNTNTTLQLRAADCKQRIDERYAGTRTAPSIDVNNVDFWYAIHSSRMALSCYGEC